MPTSHISENGHRSKSARPNRPLHPLSTSTAGMHKVVDAGADRAPVPANLQRTIGNRAIASYMQQKRAAVQTQLTVGPVDDPYEREADAVAEAVMRAETIASPAESTGAQQNVQRKPLSVEITPLVQRTSDAHAAGCACSACNSVQRASDHQASAAQVQRAFGDDSAHDHGGNCGCSMCGIVQRSARIASDGGFDASASLSQRVHALEGKGSLLPETVRRSMESAFDADFGNVRLHQDGEAARLNRAMGANAFTFRNHIAFAQGKGDIQSSAGKRLLAHELTHTIQQTGGVQRKPAARAAWVQRYAQPQTPVKVQGAINSGHPDALVQRHSSWEHMLIGELSPDDLAVLGAAYDVGATGQTTYPVGAGNQVVQKTQVVHLIEQEIRRLSEMMDAAPKIKKKAVRDKGSKQINWAKAATEKRKEETRLKNTEGPNSTWQVEFVLIPTTNGELLPVTYGELNTLADFYGSVDELKEADPSWLKRVIRGVRMSAVEKLTKVYQEVTGSSKKTLKNRAGKLAGRTAKMPIGPTSDVWMGSDAGELRQMGVIPSFDSKSLSGGKKSTGYQETLARNACHFAPESWHSWADYHAKARALALESFQAANTGNRRIAAEKRNDAMLNNGFGDHYLQDSYAAGHLINKTQVMQWYVKWIDTAASGRWKQYFDDNWRRMQAMAYNQPGLSDPGQYNKANVRQGNQSTARSPQAVRTNQTGQGWQATADALGIQAPASLRAAVNSDERNLMEWWQSETAHKWKIRKPREKKFGAIRTAPFLQGDATRAATALLKLIQDGVVRPADWSQSSQAFYNGMLPHQFSPTDGQEFLLREQYAVGKTSHLAAASNNMAQKGQAVAFTDYKYFIKSTFLQKATNALHNYFCRKGLEVAADAGPVFKVYGDDNMFKSGASAGLKHSGETAKMSKDAITDIITAGNTAHTQASILARLPSRVKLPAYTADPTNTGGKTGDKILQTPMPPVAGAKWNAPGQTVSIEEWHNGRPGESGPLNQFCNDHLFPAMTDERGGNIIGPAFMGTLGEPTPERVHAGDLF